MIMTENRGEREHETVSMTSTKTRLANYKLDDRPGIELILDGLADRALVKSIKDGLRLSLSSILHSHQKIVQLLALMDNNQDIWKGLDKQAHSDGHIKKWHKNYLQSITAIDSASEGLYKTLCSFIYSSANREETQHVLESFKDNRSTEYDLTFLPWGKGSLVHSLADAMMMFIDDTKIKSVVKDTFVRKAKRVNDITDDETAKLEQNYRELNEHFGQNFEYTYGRALESLDLAMKQSDVTEVHELPHDCEFIGHMLNGKMEGYGVFSEGDDIIYKGQFVDGQFDGMGECYIEGQKKYMGKFKNSRPNGLGVLYKQNMAVYKGEVMESMRHGVGEELYDTGKPAFRGYFYSEKADGFGVSFHRTGKRSFVGYFKNGKRHGFGKEFDVQGVDILEGYWENGKQIQKHQM